MYWYFLMNFDSCKSFSRWIWANTSETEINEIIWEIHSKSKENFRISIYLCKINIFLHYALCISITFHNLSDYFDITFPKSFSFFDPTPVKMLRTLWTTKYIKQITKWELFEKGMSVLWLGMSTCNIKKKNKSMQKYRFCPSFML